jgi:hypothetical protein
MRNTYKFDTGRRDVNPKYWIQDVPPPPCGSESRV